MLLSMTGFGEARLQGDLLTLSVEVRTVNNRYLKVSVRGSEPYPMFEPELEKLVRKFVRRGTVTIHVRCDRQVRANRLYAERGCPAQLPGAGANRMRSDWLSGADFRADWDRCWRCRA